MYLSADRCDARAAHLHDLEVGNDVEEGGDAAGHVGLLHGRMRADEKEAIYREIYAPDIRQVEGLKE